MQKQRVAWVDAARALGILAIVYSHAVYGEGGAAQCCYAFHVPLFCFCAGYVFHDEDTPFLRFTLKRARVILWPWLLFCLISIGLYAVGAGRVMETLGDVKDPSPLHALTETLRGYCYANSPLWFLPCFFLQQLLFRLLTGLPACRRQPVLAAAAAGLISALAAWLYLSRPHPQLPWAVDTAVILLPFTCLGYALRRVKSRLSPKAALPGGLAFIAAGLLGSLLVNTKVNYWDNEYGLAPLFYLNACLILLGLWAALSALPEPPEAVMRVGRDSQSILLMHKFPVLFFQVFIPFTAQALREAAPLPALLVSLICVLLCCLAAAVIRRWLPWMLGISGKGRPSAS